MSLSRAAEPVPPAKCFSRASASRIALRLCAPTCPALGFKREVHLREVSVRCRSAILRKARAYGSRTLFRLALVLIGALPSSPAVRGLAPWMIRTPVGSAR